MQFPAPNSDESLQFGPERIPFIGSFHKTLPHNDFGEVDLGAYRDFACTCLEIDAGALQKFEGTAAYAISPTDFDSTADVRLTRSVARLTSPMAGASQEVLGPSPRSLEMLPAPSIGSASTAAEMVELYWMALLRDVPICDFHSDMEVSRGVDQVEAAYATALSRDRSHGRIRLGLDLPMTESGQLDVRVETLFRCGLQDEDYGPLISQFFLQDIPYGVQTISSKQIPYKEGVDFLTTHSDWLRAQNTGKDKFGRDYANCNNYEDQLNPGRRIAGADYYPDNLNPRYISTMRDLARFVNRDALHQAYFNAALFLDALGAPLDHGNPYGSSRSSREGGFATLGGPDLLTLVSEVASRALKVVWRQKWFVHRRARPEVYGGLLQIQKDGYSNGMETVKRCYGLPEDILDAAAALIKMKNSTYFLPMAFSAGSPTHPSYGAGHATVAGACVTVLKAWFDEEMSLLNLYDQAAPKEPPGTRRILLKPGQKTGPDQFDEPSQYTDADAANMTVGGELNKIASNVAMGRSMGGVHWRSDNTRSLRLGEKIGLEILRKRSSEYAERPVSFSFRSFDRKWVTIANGQIAESD